jgi:hypothetical protein
MTIHQHPIADPRIVELAKAHANAVKLASAAQDYALHLAKALDRTLGPGKYIAPCDSYLLRLCTAALDVADDGDFYALRLILIDDNDWDEDGNDLGQSAAEREADRADYLYEQMRDRRMEEGL